MKELCYVRAIACNSAKKTPSHVFSRSLITDFRIPIFTERLPVAASKIHKFLTSFLKSVLNVEIDICFSTKMYFLPAEVKK